MTTFQPGDRVRTTRDIRSRTGVPHRTGASGAVASVTEDGTWTHVDWDDRSLGRIVPTDALALEVNGL